MCTDLRTVDELLDAGVWKDVQEAEEEAFLEEEFKANRVHRGTKE